MATVGKTLITPGGVNAIPSAATGWLDARGADEAAVRRTVDEVTAAAADWGATVTEESWTATTRFDLDLLARLRRVLPAAPAARHRGRARRRDPRRSRDPDRR